MDQVSAQNRRNFLKQTLSVVGAAAAGSSVGANAQVRIPEEDAWSPRRSDYEGEVVLRAWQDPEFRERLRAAPKDVLAEVLGKRLPTDLRVSVVEEEPQEIVIRVPVDPHVYLEEGEEISEENLNMVAAGVFDTPKDTVACPPHFFVATDFVPNTVDWETPS